MGIISNEDLEMLARAKRAKEARQKGIAKVNAMKIDKSKAAKKAWKTKRAIKKVDK